MPDQRQITPLTHQRTSESRVIDASVCHLVTKTAPHETRFTLIHARRMLIALRKGQTERSATNQASTGYLNYLIKHSADRLPHSAAQACTNFTEFRRRPLNVVQLAKLFGK